MFRDTSMDYLSRDEVLEIWNNNIQSSFALLIHILLVLHVHLNYNQMYLMQ